MPSSFKGFVTERENMIVLRKTIKPMAEKTMRSLFFCLRMPAKAFSEGVQITSIQSFPLKSR